VSIRYLFRSWFVGLFSYETADNGSLICAQDGTDRRPNVSTDLFANFYPNDVSISSSVSSANYLSFIYTFCDADKITNKWTDLCADWCAFRRTYGCSVICTLHDSNRSADDDPYESSDDWPDICADVSAVKCTNGFPIVCTVYSSHFTADDSADESSDD
jgi:hypothetical protein